MWLLTFPPTLVIMGLVLIFADAPSREGVSLDTLPYVLSRLVFAPVVENLVLVAIISILSCFISSANKIAIIASLVAALAHARSSWAPHGLIVAWLFYVLSRAYLVWRPRGIRIAYFVTVLMHAAHNLIPTSLVAALKTIAIVE